MKVLGLNGTSVIVELNNSEWERIGGKTDGCPRTPNIKAVPDIKAMADALYSIRQAQPDLERIRASFKTFLMLTEPEAISEVLKACGVAKPVETIEEADREE